ncbi:MAG: MarR family winged helix-turn-helix transcriptional regulator [Rudaea sp.]|nr:MarR family winged helix-turn-helix transcriptional regulator [Rudaea sp.]
MNLRRAARAISHLYDEAIASSGLKVTQFSLLRAVARNEPVAISVLAGEMELDRTTLARNLAPLERERLVVRSAGRDRRITEVRLSAAGRAAIQRALPLWKTAQAQVRKQLGREQVAQLNAIAARAGAALVPAASLKSAQVEIG